MKKGIVLHMKSGKTYQTNGSFETPAGQKINVLELWATGSSLDLQESIIATSISGHDQIWIRLAEVEFIEIKNICAD